MTTRFTMPVDAPPRAAFDYLADPRHRPEWQSSLRAVDRLTAPDGSPAPGPPPVGTRWVDRTLVGAGPRLEITESTPPGAHGEPGAWSEAGTWRGLRAWLRLTFAPGGAAGTTLGVELAVEGSGAWSPVVVTLRALAPYAVRADLRRAARIVRMRSWRVPTAH
ncbi:SRPBCC family protein [Puerhibacterium puerhi]|uniref:SRPBCC family protein n=1 Tax=Puerhibacterium puerhi TaxID=2692623 RepID=UPI00135BFC03|nr:SRPBCC family protein [Puerhibacterium puerhi]